MEANKITLKEKKVKVAFCKCGKGIFLISVLPYAETNKSSIRAFAKYAREGYKVDYVSVDEAQEKLYNCECYKDERKK